MHLIIGNGFTLFAMLSDSFSSTRKTAKGVLWVQNLSQVFYIISSLALGGYSAAVQNAVSIVRNLCAIRGFSPKWLQWTLVVLGVVLGVYCNNLKWIGLLPVVSNFLYTLAVFRYSDNERALKWAFLIVVIMFAVFNAFIWNVVGVFSNSAVGISLLVSLLKKKKVSQEETQENH